MQTICHARTLRKRAKWAGVLCSLLLLFGAVPVNAEEQELPAILVDGQSAEALTVVSVEGIPYLSLGLTALYLREDSSSGWDEYGRLVITGEDLKVTAKPGNCYIGANERYLYLSKGVRQDEYGDVLIPASAAAWAFNATLVTGENGELQFVKGEGSIRSGEDYYDPEAVDLLARVIRHECGRGSTLGQIAVGNVILNRVGHPSFPNSLEEVIYQPGQFTGATSIEPDSESIIAAKLCIEGASVVGNACWFSQAGRSSWASQNKKLVTVLGGNAFYA